MARQGINTGTSANSGTGDTLLSGGVKINENFSEVYTLLGDGTTLAPGIVTSILAGDNITVGSSTGQVTITGSGSTANVRTATLVVTGVSTLGVVTGATYYGDGSNLTGLSTQLSQLNNDVGFVTFTNNNQLTNGAGYITTSFTNTNQLTNGAGFVTFTNNNQLTNGAGYITTSFTNTNQLTNGAGFISSLDGVDGSGLTGITTLISAGTNITLTTASGITTINSSGGGGITTANVSADTLVVSGVSSVGIITASELFVTGISSISDNLFIGAGRTVQAGVAGTDWDNVTLSGLSPSSFNETYQTQTTGFVLDTGTVSSGNALFHADSNYYYYVATTGSSPEDRMLIFSVEDNSWVTVFSFSDPDYREGNVSNNQAVGSVFSATVTANSTTESGRNTPVASGSIVYDSTTGITTTGIGVTITADGNAIFSGITTSTNGFISAASTSACQITFVGNQLTFTVAGIGSTTLTLS